MNHPTFKSFDYAESFCNSAQWDVLAEFDEYLANGGDINECDRDGTTAMEITRVEIATPGPGSAAMKSATRERATTLQQWLITRGATVTTAN